MRYVKRERRGGVTAESNLGGHLQIISQPEKGTRLLIEFPLKEDLDGKGTGIDS